MSGIWQDVVALGVVALAGVYLGRRGLLLLARKKTGGCGGCASCPQTQANVTPESRPLVTLEVRTDPIRR